jgi:hypothetical protein
LDVPRQAGLFVSAWLAWTRNAAIAWGALMLFAATVTHLLAAIFAHAPEFGQPIAFWYGHPLYHPWRFLEWSLALAPQHRWVAFLCLLLALICALAAFAVLALTGCLAPADLAPFKSRRGFCSRDKLGQCGLLAANGLALGGVRRHGLAKFDIVSAPVGNVLLVGAPEHADAAMLAAIAAWPGALVFVDARGLARRLARHDVLCFAPGRGDSVSYNPMLAVRAGAHAWADALLLARAMLGSNDDALIEAFAVVILDQLINAPIDERNLSSLRARLGQPHRVLTEISAAWREDLCRASAPYCEIARTVRAWRKQPNAALAYLATIDAALGFLANGANVTDAHQLRFADLVSAEGPRTIALEFPRTHADQAAPLMEAVLAQLASACAANAVERPNKRELLIVLEVNALKLLAAHGALSILIAQSAGAGYRLLAQAESLKNVPQGACDIVCAIGPQSEQNAEMLSKRGGEISEWRLLQRDEHSIRAWALPNWARVKRPIVSPEDLTGANANQAMVFVHNLPPIRARAVCVAGPPATFLNGAELKPIDHDWQTPPPVAAPSAASTTGAPPPQPAPIGANIRAALSRRAPPKPKPKARSS